MSGQTNSARKCYGCTEKLVLANQTRFFRGGRAVQGQAAPLQAVAPAGHGRSAPAGCPPAAGAAARRDARPAGSAPACFPCFPRFPRLPRRAGARPSLAVSPGRSPERPGRARRGAGRAGGMKRSLLRLCRSREKTANSSDYQGVVCEADAASVASQDVFKVRAGRAG